MTQCRAAGRYSALGWLRTHSAQVPARRNIHLASVNTSGHSAARNSSQCRCFVRTATTWARCCSVCRFQAQAVDDHVALVVPGGSRAGNDESTEQRGRSHFGPSKGEHDNVPVAGAASVRPLIATRALAPGTGQNGRHLG